MPFFVDAAVDDGVDARLALISHVSAHTAYSASGANEVSGGSYARQAIAWDASASRIGDNTDAESIPIPSSTTVRWLGFWGALTAGTFYGMVPNGATVAHVAVALDTDTIYAPAHGFVADDTVVFLPVDGAVPTGITAGTVYYVRATPTTDTFEVSATQGGAAVNITGSAAAIVCDIVEETFSGSGTLNIAAGALDVKGLF